MGYKNNGNKNVVFKNKVKIFSIFCSFLFPTLTFYIGSFAQVYTFDYLTSSDNAISKVQPVLKSQVTGFIFKNQGEFKESEKPYPSYNPYYEYYLYVAYALIKKEKFNLLVSSQIGGLLSEGNAGRMWGTPWIWGKFRLCQKLPLTFRLGFEWGHFGKAIWLDDNKMDAGILLSEVVGPFVVDATFSYRFRSKSNKNILDFAGLYNNPGNEVHYKFHLTKQITSKWSFASILFGYSSSLKKYNEIKLPDSQSRKTTFGLSCLFKQNERRILVLCFLYDVAGRYDKKGYSIVFNVNTDY